MSARSRYRFLGHRRRIRNFVFAVTRSVPSDRCKLSRLVRFFALTAIPRANSPLCSRSREPPARSSIILPRPFSLSLSLPFFPPLFRPVNFAQESHRSYTRGYTLFSPPFAISPSDLFVPSRLITRCRFGDRKSVGYGFKRRQSGQRDRITGAFPSPICQMYRGIISFPRLLGWQSRFLVFPRALPRSDVL